MTMKKIAYFLMTLVAAVTVFSSCSDDETYADQKKRERNAINRYISEKGIKVLKESEFEAWLRHRHCKKRIRLSRRLQRIHADNTQGMRQED